MSNELLLIKAFGRSAEAKLKGLLALSRAEVNQLPHKSVSRINAIAAELIEGFDPDQSRASEYVPKRLRA